MARFEKYILFLCTIPRIPLVIERNFWVKLGPFGDKNSFVGKLSKNSFVGINLVHQGKAIGRSWGPPPRAARVPKDILFARAQLYHEQYKYPTLI